MFPADCLSDCRDFNTLGICFPSFLCFWPFTQWTWTKMQNSFHVKIKFLSNIASHKNVLSHSFIVCVRFKDIPSFLYPKCLVYAEKRWKRKCVFTKGGVLSMSCSSELSSSSSIIIVRGRLSGTGITLIALPRMLCPSEPPDPLTGGS